MWWAIFRAFTAAAQPMKPIERALDRGVERERRDELLVETRRREARAGRHDEVGERGAAVLQIKGRDGAPGKVERAGLEARHAGGGAGEAPARIEALAVGRRVEPIPGREMGIAVLDAGAPRHAGEEAPGALVRQHAAHESDEGLVHVVGRDGGSDAVDVGEGHGVPG